MSQIPNRVSVFFCLRELGLERLNAARMSAAGDGWTEPSNYFSSLDAKKNANESNKGFTNKAVSSSQPVNLPP